MSQPYLGAITLFGGNFAPRGWAFCAGQLMSIAEYSALYALLGTTYGGDGINTFGLPDLRGRTPIHPGQGSGLSLYALGQMGGEEAVTLTPNQVPAHQHQLFAVDSNATTPNGSGVLPAKLVQSGGGAAASGYIAAAGPTVPMAPLAGANSGGSQPHDNLPPYLGLNYIIALEGIFPSRN